MSIILPAIDMSMHRVTSVRVAKTYKSNSNCLSLEIETKGEGAVKLTLYLEDPALHDKIVAALADDETDHS